MKIHGKRARFIVPRSEWAITVIHLATWAQIGVIIRAFLGKLFELGCGGSQWGPCLAGKRSYLGKRIGLKFYLDWMFIRLYLRCSHIVQCIRPTDTVHVTCFWYCFVGGVYFKDLPANMLGSFIIGLVGTSNMLGITENRAVGFLPADHVWQANIPLQTGE